MVASALEARQYLAYASIIGSFYTGAGISAMLYPGTAWIDKEFVREDGMTQKPIFIGIIGVMALGYAIEAFRLR